MLLLLIAQAWTDVEWEPNPGWKIDGRQVERVDKGGNLFSKESYGDFLLRLEFKLPRGGNSGLIFRSRACVEHQVEIVADAGQVPHSGSSGGIFRRAIPTSNAAKPAGEWNALELEVRGRTVRVTYNGVKVVDKAVVDDLPFRGPVGLQDHGTPLWFRDIRIQRLDAPAPAWDVEAGPPLSAAETKAFMRALAQYVFDHHLKKDSEQRGMIYEYYEVPAKRWLQGEALDTMHDGAWFGAALATAARAAKDPFYEEFLTRWTLPFYLKMLNESDRLFSAERDDAGEGAHRFGLEHRLQAGEKGFVPYWWDDGASFSLEAARKKSGKPVFSCTDRLAGKENPEARLDGWSHGSSNHLAQDLAILLLTSKAVSKDPRIDEAAKNLLDCRARHGAPRIPVVLAAAGQPVPAPKIELRNPWLESGEKPVATPGFSDNQEYLFYLGVPSKDVALKLVYDALTLPQLLRIWSDVGEIPPGLGRFDLGALAFRNGKPESYRSDRLIPMGSRVGPQTMVVAGWALQALEAYPGLWEDPEAAPVLDGPYTLDAKAGERYGKPLTLGDVEIRVAGHPAALLIAGSAKGESASLAVEGARIALRKDRTWEAVDARGEALRMTAHVVPTPEGFAFELALPWTSAKDQRPWANLIERKSYAVGSGDVEASVRIASSEARVKAALRRELGQGLRAWKTLFERFGYIPTGIGRWDAYSDAGGYAHLLKAGAQWLFVLEGKQDW